MIARRIIPLLLAAVPFAGGCGSQQTTDGESPAPIVYVDTRTKAVVLAERTADLPAVNPATGRRTLMPGLYCAKCRKWYPAPPLDVQQRNPASRKCPKHRTPLTADGPLPEK